MTHSEWAVSRVARGNKGLKGDLGVTLEAGQHPPVQSSQDVRQKPVLQEALSLESTGQGETPLLGQARAVGVGRGYVWPTHVRGDRDSVPAGREGCPGQESHVTGPFHVSAGAFPVSSRLKTRQSCRLNWNLGGN